MESGHQVTFFQQPVSRSVGHCIPKSTRAKCRCRKPPWNVPSHKPPQNILCYYLTPILILLIYYLLQVWYHVHVWVPNDFSRTLQMCRHKSRKP